MPATQRRQRLAVVGMGLLGGSVAKAARERHHAREIIGVGRDAGRLRPAVVDGTLDHATTDLAAGVSGADVVVLAPPVQTLERLLPAVWAVASPEALITDVGSTKAAIVAAAERLAGERPLAFVAVPATVVLVRVVEIMRILWFPRSAK